MRTRSVLALLALVAGLLAAATAPTSGQDPHPVAQPTPTPATPPTPSPAPAPEGTKDEKEKAPGEKKWNVETPPYPMSVEAAIDTDEGTWMSVDVSSDGKEIVFDLLGDVYLLPVAGGEAKALTSGVSWDMQPRFSPDGKRIAFTSDRSGGDNVWIMERDGSKPVQVTKETFRLPNSAVWAPDGDFLAVRKHFTGTRSLGAGEIWLYHRSGGDGLQMTKRGNEQKDLGEPAFSPDGRYLYYSQDITPGRIFQYNKDPHGEIYAIQRLDRVTGRTERFVTGPGGAVRPTPSRDGKWLAFVRRVGPKTVLFTKDLQSGREHPVWDGLERDMQETWAIHGVYPAMAWAPDGRSIVLWSGGKIRRVDRETGGVATVPFHVKDTRKMAPAARFPVEVAPPRFPVRMLRWVQVSPSGNQVVYQALGRLWVKDLPDGAPRRLTKQTDHFELEPSYSKDGRSIVYTTWTDEKAGSLRVAPARGGEGRTITAQPGHYREPVFSPDGSRIVFRKGTGGFLVTSDWSMEPGIYAVPAAGGTPRRVARDGFLPQFGSESDRVYFTKLEETEASREAREDEKRVLASVSLEGAEEREHYVSDNATEYRISPDEKWLAFRERYNVFVAPFVRTGRKIEIGPKAKALPVTRVSRDAGDYLHWSGDSRTLHWTLGPELFGRALPEAFAFLPGAPEKLPEPLAAGKPIGFESVAEAPQGGFALVGGRVVTMRGDEVLENGTILVEGNRVTAVGPKDQVRVPAGARVIDVTGKTVLPGILDVHWHGAMGRDGVIPQQNWVTDAALAFGVTTVHDPSHDTAQIFAASEMARAGLVRGPRIFSTGTILYGAAGDIKVEVDSLDDARAHLRRMKAVGAFSVKSYNQPRRDQRQQILAAAKELSMMVVPEGGSLFQHNLNMVVDGHTGVEHSIPVPGVYKDVFQLWSRNGVGYTPTLVVGYGGLWGENYWYQHTEVWKNERLARFVPPFVLAPRARRRVLAGDDDFNHLNNARVARQLADAGVPVQVGAHGQREGLGAHWEIWMLVQGGMTPHQALRSATLTGAKYLGLDRDLGSIEPGKLADFAVIDGDPLGDIRQSEKVQYTVVNGKIYDAATLNELGAAAKRPVYWWENR
ncbi:MAG: PD40 domain-containing protein [Thermoanaerobaculia bacterium]|nr:PD40 domain-containing protein [Thermoanaerobaculia bacterium]